MGAVKISASFTVSIHAPTGGATGSISSRVASASFNSRAHGGRDRGGGLRRVTVPVSIHAPTGGATGWVKMPETPEAFQFTRPRGARRSAAAAAASSTEFQFTRPRGARRGAGIRTRTPSAFQFTRPRGARRDTPSVRDASGVFQFTRPRGARPAKCSGSMNRTVSIHAPTGGATHPSCRPAQTRTFQFTRPRGARLAGSASEIEKNGFNSRAHGGRDSQDGDAVWTDDVSIHAPTGGATYPATRYPPSDSSFNSRAHGGRDEVVGQHEFALVFQFTRPRGARQELTRQIAARRNVSIHAPTGGATGRDERGLHDRVVSIHAPTGGATEMKKYELTDETFQFTRPRGARR